MLAPAPLAALLLAIVAMLSPPAALADSPITSTDLASAYQDIAQVRAAAGQAPRLADPALMDWLLDDATPNDQAVAAINALGLDPSLGHGTNHLLLLERLRAVDPARAEAFRNGKGSGHLLLVIGYAWAKDEYFKVDQAKSLLRQAQRRLPQSFTVAFVLAIVEAQDVPYATWCEVAMGPRRLINRWGRHAIDLRRQAIEDALRYMDDYSSYCR